MAKSAVPDWRLAKKVLPSVKDRAGFDPEVHANLLTKLHDDGLMPSSIQADDLHDVDELIRKLEVIASQKL
jgi:hypothetical protein